MFFGLLCYFSLRVVSKHMRRGMIVYNPTAGRFPSGMLVERAAQVLRQHDWQLRLEQSLSGEHITQLARQAAAEAMEGFFVVGGDGTLNLALPGLLGSQTALGVLPAGTANVWARELGLPGLSWTRWMALEESARLLAESEVRTVDIGLCNDKPFLLWAGIGLDGFVIHRIEPRNRWEKHLSTVYYTASAAWNATSWRGVNLRVQVDGRQVVGHYLLALVSNIHLYGGGWMHISPDARLDDGSMDLWLVEGDTMADTVQRMWDLISGRHLHSEHIMRYPFQSLSLESDSPLYIQLDAEPVDGIGPVSIRVVPQVLHVFVPRVTPHLLFGSQISEGHIP
jgi:diacylglycerol kinase (ATP)